MSWTNLYQSKMVSAEEAVSQIKSRAPFFLTGNCSVPQTVLSALVDHAPQLQDVEICQALSVGPADHVAPAMEGHLKGNTMVISATIRQTNQNHHRRSQPANAAHPG